MDINVYKNLPGRKRKFNPQCNPSAVVYFDTAELERLVDLSGKSGMPESDYIRCVLEHALECGCTFMKQ